MQRAVEAWLAQGRPADQARPASQGQPAKSGAPASGGPSARLLHENSRRRIVAVESSEDGRLVVKRFLDAGRSRKVRHRLRALVGRSPADREWRVLSRLHAAGVPVPEPVGRGVLPDGDPLLVTRWVKGEPLADAVRERGRRRRVLVALGEAVAAMHAAGIQHRDLHQGNVLAVGDAVVLLDFQRARRLRSRRSRLRDLGWLDASLRGVLSTPDRVRLRVAAFGLDRAIDANAARQIRAVGEAAARRVRQHARSRTRHSLRAGRRFEALAGAGRHGLCDRRLGAEGLAAALAAHRRALADADARVIKNDGRSRITGIEIPGRRLVVKEIPPRNPLRPLADAVRGSAGWRAWRGGHGLAARGIGVALPQAYLERRRFGLPVSSLIVLEDLRPDVGADVSDREGFDPVAVVVALGRLAERLHEAAVDHGDLKASHVYLRRGPHGLATRLIDLEGVRFPRRLSRARRLQALAELNASLPDAFPDSARRRAFADYVHRLPLPGGTRGALETIVRRSLERGHRWSGEHCQSRPVKSGIR